MERALYQKIAFAVWRRRFSCTSLRHEWNDGVSLYREYPNIFHSVSRQSFLSWSHYRVLLGVECGLALYLPYFQGRLFPILLNVTISAEKKPEGDKVMIYTKRTKAAMELILRAHQGQVDKGGYPYVFHPFHVAEQMQDESTCLVALLHDVLEDCEGYSLEKVSQEVGLNEQEQRALFLMTHDETIPYRDYVIALSCDPIARKVKIADLTHNLDLTRVGGVPTKKHALMQECLKMLKDIEEGRA